MFSNNFKIPSSNNIDFISSRITYPRSFPNQKILDPYPLIVACHGIFLNKYTWDRLLETYINNDYIFVDMDLRGFGLSDGSFPPLASAAKDVLILTNYVCKKLENYYDPKRVTLMGFSLGGMVVIQALLQPNPFTSCVLLSPGTTNIIENNNNTIIIQKYFFLNLLAKLNGRQMGDEKSPFAGSRADAQIVNDFGCNPANTFGINCFLAGFNLRGLRNCHCASPCLVLIESSLLRIGWQGGQISPEAEALRLPKQVR